MQYKKTILSDLADYVNGFAFKPSDWKEEGTKIIRIEQLNNPKGRYDYYDGIVQNCNAIDNEDLIFSWSATLKVVIWKYGKGVLNQHLFKVLPYNNTNKYFLFHLLDYNMDKLSESSHGSTMKHIKREELDKYIVIVPVDKTEQEKIAKILSTCDSVIEKTEETIEKYKQIKVGMMQDLFTRGLDESGKLRPKYQDAPELYKYSEELDRYIPKDWEVFQMSNLGEFKNGLNKEKKYFGYGTKFVNIIDAYKENLDIFALELVETNNNDRLIYSLNKGDLIFVRSSVKPEGVGYNTIFMGANEPIVYCGFMIRFRLFDTSNVNPEYINYYYRTELFRKKLISKSTVSANTNINQESLNELYTVLPKKGEQNKIVEIIKQINKKIYLEQQYLSKYKQIKQGLMKKLLTPPADAEIVEE